MLKVAFEKIFLEVFCLEKTKILAAVLAVLAISSAVGYQFFKGKNTNYLDAITETYQAAAEIQSDLSIAAGNLSSTDSASVETFTRKLNSAKDILLKKNKSFGEIDVPEKSAEDNKKLIECLKAEYNLMNRWKEAVSISNEYEATENLTKSKELMLELKEKSAMLSIEGNNFEDIFDLATAYEKVEKYLNTKKQLRYDKDQKDQAARDQAAEAEKAKQQAAAAEAARKQAQAGRSPLGYHWIQDNNSGVYLYNPQPTDGETVFWSGGYVQDGDYKFADGRGTLTWKKYGKTTQIDEGSFIHGRHHGQFKHIFPISGRVEYSNWDHGVEIR